MGADRVVSLRIPTPKSTACLPGMISFPLGHPPALDTYPVPPSHHHDSEEG